MLRKNRNSRCLIAIEIENTNSKKHMMGSIVNAASLGRIGIGVAYCDSAMRTFLGIVNYLNFLKRVEKNSFEASLDLFNWSFRFLKCWIARDSCSALIASTDLVVR